jgi:hypothetical protein
MEFTRLNEMGHTTQLLSTFACMSTSFALLLTVICCCFQMGFAQVTAESNWVWSHAFNLGLMNFEPIESQSGGTLKSKLGRHIEYQMGYGYLHKERFGVSAELSLMTKSYVLANNSTSRFYDIVGFISPGFRVYRLWDIPSVKSGYVGASLGYNFINQPRESLNYQWGSNTIETNIAENKNHLITPMIELTSLREKYSYSLAAGYQFATSSVPMMEVKVVQKGGGYDVFAGRSNAILFRINFGIFLNSTKDKVQKKIAAPMDAEDLEYRDEKELPVIKSDRRRVCLEIYDNGEVDNDTVTVSLNGEYILSNYRLTKYHKKIWVDLYKGENRIVFMANNEGKNPPNTAHCTVIMGSTRRILTVASDLETNSVLIIECDL